jgi:sarcosine/dimethylglycine N-methyltransferase
LGSIAFYRQQARELGWQELAVTPMTDQLVRHYTRVREELVSRREELLEHVSPEFLDRMVRGLGHWIEAGSRGYLAWGILHFRATP